MHVAGHVSKRKTENNHTSAFTKRKGFNNVRTLFSAFYNLEIQGYRQFTFCSGWLAVIRVSIV